MSAGRRFLFRWRGALLAPVALALVVLARPSEESLALGLLASLLGESLRFWALGYTGEPTRSQELCAPLLVTAGPYSLTRNPLYLGNVLNGLGVAVAAAGGHEATVWAWMVGGTAAVLGAVYGPIVGLEEAFLRQRFGQEYLDYCARVPRFLPRRARPLPGRGAFSLATALRFERATLLWLGLVWASLAWRLG